MLRVLDIGNTHTRIADWDGCKFCNQQVIDTTDFCRCFRMPEYPVVAACVCPQIKAELKDSGIIFVSALENSGLVDFSLIDRTTLGADRVANAVALAGMYPLPGAVIDCGTAITLEMVDENRRFIGGAIAPGRALMRHSLETGTAQLPKTRLLEHIHRNPGRNTVDAIGLGIVCAAAGVVKELANVARENMELKTLILTGGDAEFFREALPEATLCNGEFTLHGVRLSAVVR